MLYWRGREWSLCITLLQHWPVVTEHILSKSSQIKSRIISTQLGSARHPLSTNYKVTSDIYTLATIHKQLSCTHFVDQLNKCLINIHPQKPLAGKEQPGIYNNALVFCVAKETGLFSMPKKKLWMQLKDQEREIECFLSPHPPVMSCPLNESICLRPDPN